jgi:hypothetical protein
VVAGRGQAGASCLAQLVDGGLLVGGAVLAVEDGGQQRQGIYNGRAFDDLPVLADALEDAGCTDRDILEHCRSGGEHVLGCWVVDLLLGKE